MPPTVSLPNCPSHTYHRCSGKVFLLLPALLLPVLLASTSAAQQRQVFFQHLTVEDGLPERNVYRILQDYLGFLWLGTADGLVRYDGYSFLRYQHEAADPHSLQGRLVAALYEDRDHQLWVGTRNGGLNLYDRRRDRFIHYQHDPHDPGSISLDAIATIFQDHDGVLWVGCGEVEPYATAGSLDRYDAASGGFFPYQHQDGDSTGIAPGPVSSIAEDGSGQLWIGLYGGGLDRYEESSESFVHHRHDPGSLQSLSDDLVTALLVDHEGRLWIATWSGGVNCLDHPEHQGRRFRRYRRSSGLSSERILSLYEDRGGDLWLGTGDGVLHRYDPESDSFRQYRHDPGDPHSLSAGISIWGIHEDRTRNLWIASRGVGLDKLDHYAGSIVQWVRDPSAAHSRSQTYSTAVLEDFAGDLWVGTRDKGLDRIDRQTGHVTNYRSRRVQPDGLSSDRVWVLLEDSSRTLWAGSNGGLDRLERSAAGDRFVSVLPDSGTRDDPGARRVVTLLEDSAGALWIATMGGLFRQDRDGRFSTYHHRPDDPHSLASDKILALLQDRAGIIWVGTENAGLCRFDPATGLFSTFCNADTGLEVIVSLHEDRNGRLWVGTFNGGLHLFDRSSGSSRSYTLRNGLPHNAVFSILEDDSGRLWLTTGTGITVFDPDSGDIKSYDHTDGIKGDFLFSGVCRSRAGELFFGSSEGLYSFFPEDLADNPHPPQVVLTGLRVAQQPLPISPDGPLTEHVSVASEVRLRHHQNIVSFAYAGLHFSRPEANRYAYRLEPLQEEWNQVGDQRQASYLNLPPGDYTFRVKAANADGVWNRQCAALRLVISPPPWRTWWAYSLLLVVVVTLLAGTERIQRARLLRRERSERQRTEAQLRATAAELEARALRAENERKTRELEDARQLQLSMLPAEVPQLAGVDLAAAMHPATEVGGDYYDFDLADDGTLTMVIGDATGHGSRAGTMVTVAKSLFNFLRGESDLVAVLRRSTTAIKRIGLGNLHMAMMVARLRGARLQVANAGMPPVLICRAATGSVEEMVLSSVPLGSLVDFPYRKETVELAAGDTVVLMTDGLPERLDPSGEMYGYEQVRSILQAVATYPPEEIIRNLCEAAADWADGRPAADDMTFVVLQLRGPAGQDLAGEDLAGEDLAGGDRQ